MMISPKLVMRLALVLAVAGAIATAVVEHNEIDRCRAEQVTLLNESQEAERLTEENKGMAALHESNSEREKLREQNKDLPALRNDVRQLRRQADELAKLRAENQQLLAAISTAKKPAVPGAVPAGFISRTALQDVGTSSPEAAAQTFLWAMSQGNLERLAQLAVHGGPPIGPNTEQQRKDLMEQFKMFPGFAIAGKKIISPDEVIIDLQTSTGGTTAPMKLRRVEGEWKFDDK